MPVSASIHHDNNQWKINSEGEGHVVVHPHPPSGETEVSTPFRDFFKTSAGSSNMLVDGSSTPIEFSINAATDRDVYIKTVSMVIVHTNAVLNKFGNLTALSNGLDFEWSTNDKGLVTIASGLKTNFSMVRLGLGDPSFGTTTSSFRASNVLGSAEGYLPVVDLERVFGIPYGLRLRKGTNDRLLFRVNDNISTMDQFDIIAYGFKF